MEVLYRYSGISVNRFSDIFMRKYSCSNTSGASVQRVGKKKPASAGVEDGMSECSQRPATAILLLEGVDGLWRDVDRHIAVSATGLKDKIDTALPLLKAFRAGDALPSHFASLRELLASFGDEPLYARQTGQFLPMSTTGADEVIVGHVTITINVPSKRLVALVAAIRALDGHGDIGDVGRD